MNNDSIIKMLEEKIYNTKNRILFTMTDKEGNLIIEALYDNTCVFTIGNSEDSNKTEGLIFTTNDNMINITLYYCDFEEIEYSECDKSFTVLINGNYYDISL